MENKEINSGQESIQGKVYDLLSQQTQEWGLAAKNYEGLQKAQRHSLKMDHSVSIDVQFNPERIYSSAAKVDAKSISERKCFLCLNHLPEQQKWVPFKENYVILVNPFPIFPQHLTIPHRQHIDQRMAGSMEDMLELAAELNGFEIFYNGPRCGASAPDHFHFQAGNKGFMPLADDFEMHPKTLVAKEDTVTIWSMDNYLRQCIVLESPDKAALCSKFETLFEKMAKLKVQEFEPMVNIIASWQQDHWKVFIFPRNVHRPRQFFAEGPDQIVLSPASVDFGGVLITPREEDYKKLKPSDIKDIFGQVCWENDQYQLLLQEIAKPFTQ